MAPSDRVLEGLGLHRFSFASPLAPVAGVPEESVASTTATRCFLLFFSHVEHLDGARWGDGHCVFPCSDFCNVESEEALGFLCALQKNLSHLESKVSEIPLGLCTWKEIFDCLFTVTTSWWRPVLEIRWKVRGEVPFRWQHWDRSIVRVELLLPSVRSQKNFCCWQVLNL